MKIKIISLYSCLLAFLFLFTACLPAQGRLNPKFPITITLWHSFVGESQYIFEKTISHFNTTIGKQEGIVVVPDAKGTPRNLDSSLFRSINHTIGSEALPQLFICYPDTAFKLAQNGLLIDLHRYFNKRELSAIDTEYLNNSILSNSNLFFLPFAISTDILYLNNTLWNNFSAENKVSQKSLSTWEQVLSTARIYYEWTDAQTPEIPFDGKSFLGVESVSNFILALSQQLNSPVLQAGWNDYGSVLLNKEALRQIFNLYYVGISFGYFTSQTTFLFDDIKNEAAIAAYVAASSDVLHFPTGIIYEEQEHPITLINLPYPVLHNTPTMPIVQSTGLSLLKSTPEQEKASSVFLHWFLAQNVNQEFSLATGYLPVTKNILEPYTFQNKISTLKTNNQAQKNIQQMYVTLSSLLTKHSTISLQPSKISYDVRMLLQRTLMDKSIAEQPEIQELRKKGYTEAEIIALINLDKQFISWLTTLENEFIRLSIPYMF